MLKIIYFIKLKTKEETYQLTFKIYGKGQLDMRFLLSKRVRILHCTL